MHLASAAQLLHGRKGARTSVPMDHNSMARCMRRLTHINHAYVHAWCSFLRSVDSESENTRLLPLLLLLLLL